MSRKRKVLTGALVIVCVAALFLGGLFAGWKIGRKFPENITVSGVTNFGEGKPAGVDFGTFWQAWKEIDSTYLNSQSVDSKHRMYGAIKGLIGSLGDPYSEFFNPEDGAKFGEDIQGSFGGVGAELGAKSSQIVVVSPLKGSPASRAGIEPGDKILAVNSSSTTGISIDQAVKWIRGPIGTKVVLTIMRDKWDKPKDITIVRETITIPTLDLDIKDKVAIVKLYSFNANAVPLFYEASLKILNSGAKGMILDLRNDPGGFLEAAVDLAGWFLPKGSLVVTQDGRNGKMDFRAVGNGVFKDTPLIILVNKGSASASEILAGAIKVYRDNVKLVGEQTFGKGTVQELRDLRDGSSLKLTIAHWVLPNGRVLEGQGLDPDIKIDLTDQDIEKGRDSQLEKAKEILMSEIR